MNTHSTKTQPTPHKRMYENPHTCSISAYRLAQTWLVRGPGLMRPFAFFHSAVTLWEGG